MPFRARQLPSTMIKRRDAALSQLRSRQYHLYRSDTFQHDRSIAGPSRLPITTYDAIQSASSDKLHRRSFSSSSTRHAFSDFFRIGGPSRNRVLSLNNARDEFLEAAKYRHVPTMRRAYEMIIHAMNLDPAPQNQRKIYFTPQDLIEGMNALSLESTPEALNLLQRMYSDIDSFHGLRVGPEHHSALAAGYCRTGRMEKALELLEKVDPKDVDWSQLLRYSVKHGSGSIEGIVEKMTKVRDLTPEDYGLLLVDHRREMTRQHGAEKQNTESRQLNEVIGQIENGGVQLSPGGEADLAWIKWSTGNVEEAKRIVRGWEEMHEDELDLKQWDVLCEMAEVEGDAERVNDLVDRMASAGKDPLARTIVFLVKHELEGKAGSSSQSGSEGGPSASAIIQALDNVERRVGMSADEEVWTRALRQFVLMDSASVAEAGTTIETSLEDCQSISTSSSLGDRAMTIYRAARSRGVLVSSEFALMLIKPLCTSTPVRFDDALEVYNDWLTGDEPEVRSVEEETATREIFESLMTACCSLDLHKRIDTVMGIMKEFLEQEIEMPTETINRLLPDLMSKAPDYRSAYTFYNDFLRTSPMSFNFSTFATAMSTFMSLHPVGNPNPVPCPPSTYVIQMLTDMQLAGIEIQAGYYRHLFSQYGLLATESKAKFVGGPSYGEQMEKIRGHISRLYTRYKLDPVIKLNPRLLHTIMDAYNRAEGYPQGLQVWYELVEKRARISVEEAEKVYPVTISVVLDLLGYQGDRATSKLVWDWAKLHGFTYQHKTWNTRIENLCRMHQFTEAQEMVFEEMRLGKDGAPKPTYSTVEILAKFTSTWDGYGPATRAGIKKYFPDWYEDIYKSLGARKFPSAQEKFKRNAVEKFEGRDQETQSQSA